MFDAWMNLSAVLFCRKLQSDHKDLLPNVTRANSRVLDTELVNSLLRKQADQLMLKRSATGFTPPRLSRCWEVLLHTWKKKLKTTFCGSKGSCIKCDTCPRPQRLVRTSAVAKRLQATSWPPGK